MQVERQSESDTAKIAEIAGIFELATSQCQEPEHFTSVCRLCEDLCEPSECVPT